MAFKQVELHNMAAYLDVDAEMIGNLPFAQLKVPFSKPRSLYNH
jgi:hypothetical protein